LALHELEPHREGNWKQRHHAGIRGKAARLNENFAQEREMTLNRPLWAPLLVSGVAVVLVSTLGMALYVGTSAMSSPQATDDADATRRCPQCGWIESQRELDATFAAEKAVRIREFTVRMSDGSSRVFQEDDPAVGWRLRERLIFIDGASHPR
jgi:hypothetical protein